MKNRIIRTGGIALLLLIVSLVNAQVIPIKSLPLAIGDQFAYLPSQNRSMAGITLAIEDNWLDPFLNPAKGIKVSTPLLFTIPNYYYITNNMGLVRSMPLGLYFNGGSLFGGIAINMQNFNLQSSPGAGNRLSDRSASNFMATGVIGFKVNKRLSIGAGGSYADMEAVDGVQMLYAWNDRVEQEGSFKSGRLTGFYQMENQRELEFLLVHQRVDMVQDIYTEWSDWGLAPEPLSSNKRTELDKHRLWGGQIIYRTPIGTRGWKMALSTIYNRKTHPKIPNYDIMRIPRDPGFSNAYQFAVGLSKTKGPVTFGMELASEPIRSKTWAEAALDTQSVSGDPLLIGSRTIENNFRFKNLCYRMGLKNENTKWGFQLGMEWRTINYKLHQIDYILETDRFQRENWLEWTFTWGLHLNFSEFTLAYQGSLLTGGGLPGIGFGTVNELAMFDKADFIVAPAGPLSLQDANVVTHRVTCIIPI